MWELGTAKSDFDVSVDMPKDEERRELVELHAVCAKAYRRLKMAEVEGGYPNFHALYKFCREHETEF